MKQPKLPRRRRSGGFTLLELLVVAGLIAAMSALVVAQLGGNHGAALAAAQSTLEQFVRAARTRAIAGGQPTRLLVQHDPTSDPAAERYLRVLALQQLRDGQWITIDAVALPDSARIVPHVTHTTPGLLADEGRWRTTKGARLHSSALFQPTVRARVDMPVEETWASLVFTELGTTSTSGQLVVGTVRNATRTGGENLLTFFEPEQVRGLQLSVYGLATPIDRPEEF